LTINGSNLHDTGHSIELTPAAAMAEQETSIPLNLNFRSWQIKHSKSTKIWTLLASRSLNQPMGTVMQRRLLPFI
jgi:hypothetical protein